MREVVYLVAASLDGQIARADGSFDCFVAEGDHVDHYFAMLGSFDDVLMGRATYEVGTKVGITDPYPSIRSHVFSSSLGRSPNEKVRLVSENAVAYVRNLKEQPGRDIYLCGGGELAANLLEAGLIDRIQVKLNPLLIGEGIPLFARVARPVRLTLTGCTQYTSGVVLLTYQVGAGAGQVR